MPVNNDQLQINPYQSSVPVVQIPPEVIGNVQPSGPLQGQFAKKGTGALAIGDAILKGVLQGHAEKQKRKDAQAQATISAADAATEAAYQKYQDSLSQAGGDVKSADAQAAYTAYLDVFNKGKEAKAQFVIPQKGDKGQKSTGGSGQGKDKKKGGIPGFGGIKEFFEANPHIVPQIALMTMQPKAQGMSRETRLQDAQTKAAETQVALGQEQLSATKEGRQRETEQYNEQQNQKKVEAAGGIEAVLSDKNASPELQQSARQMKYSALDKQSPLEQMKTKYFQDVQSGQSKNWTPEQRATAAIFGAVPQPVPTTIMGKNGHQQQVLIDPMTNQPIAGSKPLDLGPPAWAQQFYAERSIAKEEIHKAVSADPAAYGITPTGDPKADKAAIDARSQELYVKSNFGISSLADSTGKTGYEVQRDNEYLNDVVKAAGLNTKKPGESPLDTGQVTMSYPGGKTFAVGREYFSKMLNMFATPSTENNGIRGFRDTPLNPDNHPPEVLESERKFMYQWVKNQMMTQKGGKALTSAQADAVLSKTALGRPVVSGMSKPPQMTQETRPTGGIGRPPTGPMKYYSVPGINGLVQMTDEEAAKARANNIPIEEISGDLFSKFNQ